MTRKHYKQLAGVLKPLYESGQTAVIVAIMKILADDNPDFNPVTFLEYLKKQ